MEENIRKCKSCGEMKKRILAGKFNEKDKKWVDESQKLWNGSICPVCVVDKARARARANNAIKPKTQA